MSTNRFGLPRAVPEAVKREIRQRCGFGCVVCGLGFYDYEHFQPDFRDAQEHDPAGMTLLCSQCNQKRARGRLSAETVARANAAPKCLERGYASEMFDFSPDGIEVRFAGVTFVRCPDLIVINDVPVLSIKEPERMGLPFRLSGRLTDRYGRVNLVVADNEFRANSGNWDVECRGALMTFRTGRGQIALAVRMDPPRRLIIERIDMLFKGVHLVGSDASLDVLMNGLPVVSMMGGVIEGAPTGMRFINAPRDSPVAANQALF